MLRSRSRHPGWGYDRPFRSGAYFTCKPSRGSKRVAGLYAITRCAGPILHRTSVSSLRAHGNSLGRMPALAACWAPSPRRPRRDLPSLFLTSTALTSALLL